MSKNSIPEPWGSFLRDLDNAANGQVDLHCIGGFVVTKKYGFHRETADVDVLSMRPKEQQNSLLQLGAMGSELHRKHRVYLQLVTVIEAYPEAYEDRLTEMYPGELTHIRLLAPEAHDLSLMKLGRNIERDREDVMFLARAGFITSAELQYRYEKEMRSYVAEPETRTDPVLRFWQDMINEGLEAKTLRKDNQT